MLGGGYNTVLQSFTTLPKSLALYRNEKKFCFKFRGKTKKKASLGICLRFLNFYPKKNSDLQAKSLPQIVIFFLNLETLSCKVVDFLFSKKFLLLQYFPVAARKILTFSKYFLIQIQLRCI